MTRTLIPYPLSVEDLPGEVTRPSLVRLNVDDPSGCLRVAGVEEFLRRALDALGIAVSEGFGPGAQALNVSWIEDGGQGSYSLSVTDAGIDIAAGDRQGFASAVATLRQLFESGDRIRAVCIEDSPQYSWRGLSLDVARSFFPPHELRAIVDLLSGLKLTVLHLHLTDDQGWRLEIPSYPELTEISGRTAIRGGRPGFLSVEEYRDLQAYASQRGVEIIPEIDMPGHTNALLHAMPCLNPDGVAVGVYEGAEVGFSQIAAEPITREVVSRIMTEVAEATESGYLHFGGDEPLAMTREDYTAAVRMTLAAVQATGKKPISWQEVSDAGLRDEAVMQFWNTGPAGSVSSKMADIARRSAEQLVRQAGSRGQVIMSPANRCYLDQMTSPGQPLGQDWAGTITLEQAYEWDPARVLPGLDPSRICGVEAGMWSETVHSFDDLLSMLLPRLYAFAEVAWRGSNRCETSDLVSRAGKLAKMAPNG